MSITEDRDLIRQHICPKCKHSMILLRSLYKKRCVNCNVDYDWELSDNQKPLIQHQR